LKSGSGFASALLAKGAFENIDRSGESRRGFAAGGLGVLRDELRRQAQCAVIGVALRAVGEAGKPGASISAARRDA
jgi:hypothetical protein